MYDEERAKNKKPCQMQEKATRYYHTGKENNDKPQEHACKKKKKTDFQKYLQSSSMTLSRVTLK